ncbi:MAG: hypothetical protein ABI551_07210, partial [Polyangiaceae bacterium]
MSTGYVFSGHTESLNASEVEREDAEVIEATLRWQGDVLDTKHFAIGKAITVGEQDGTDFTVPVSSLGTTWAEVVGASFSTMVQGPAGATMLADGIQRDAREPLELRKGHACSLAFGEFSLELEVVAAGRATPASFMEAVRNSALGTIGASFMAHAAIFASLAMFLPSMSGDDAESIDRDRLYTMQHYLDSAADREREREATAPSSSDDASGGAGGQTAGESGKMGTTTDRVEGRMSIKGNAKPDEVMLPRDKQLAAARDFGMNQLVGMLAVSIDNDGKSVPWGDVANGADRETHLGNLWSTDIGDASGFGWGLSGTGEGGGCQGGPCTGVGINGISGLGVGIGKCDNPPCVGFDHGAGRSHGILPGNHVPKGPGMRWAKEISVNGRIPQEVIQRIVRQNAGRYRACYESGLRSNPSLGGRVAVKFVI